MSDILKFQKFKAKLDDIWDEFIVMFVSAYNLVRLYNLNYIN
jgi:hypothetical protein